MDFITRRAGEWFQSVSREAMPDPDEVHRWVAKLRKKNPNLTPDELASRAVDAIKWKVWLIAIVAGVFSNPVLCVVLAWVETKKLIKWQVETAAKIAGILAPEALNDRAGFEQDVLAVLMPQSVDEELELAARTTVQVAAGTFASRAASQATRTVIRRVIAKDTLKFIKRFALRYLGVKVTQRAVLSKAVPVAGIFVGVAMNHWEINRTGRSAIAYFRRSAEALPAGPAGLLQGSDLAGD